MVFMIKATANHFLIKFNHCSCRLGNLHSLHYELLKLLLTSLFSTHFFISVYFAVMAIIYATDKVQWTSTSHQLAIFSLVFKHCRIINQIYYFQSIWLIIHGTEKCAVNIDSEDFLYYFSLLLLYLQLIRQLSLWNKSRLTFYFDDPVTFPSLERSLPKALT